MSAHNNNNVVVAKRKSRTARDVLNRIRWDDAYDAHHIVFGYEDRLVGYKELVVAQYQSMDEGGDIPEHRIVYVRHWPAHTPRTRIRDEDFLWDRFHRIDRVFGSSGTGSGIPQATLQMAQQAAETTERLQAEMEELQQRQRHEVEARALRHQLAAQHLELTNPSLDERDNNSSNRKRNLEQVLADTTSNVASEPIQNLLRYGPDGQVLDLPRPLRKLRLEAIFHPKFENESQTDKEIRRRMVAAIQDGRGYLEVSLKHSGSLLLWSGGHRFYSKNSTENVFTHVGEILLKQHFVRAYWEELSDTTNNLMDKFDECSTYVQEHRLTLSFEAVTAVTGDHGDRPRRDFLILTAVADRNQQRFWGTDEIVAFAQRFRLPHNDAWIFKSMTSVQKLFEFYDGARETSYATDVVTAMSETADTQVFSMLPHVDFQGEILEGLVIRFVACSAESTVLDTLQELATHSSQIAALVPPSRPDAWELLQSQVLKNESAYIDSLLTTNLRELHRRTKFGEREGPSSFPGAVARVMEASKLRRRVVKVPKSAIDMDLPTWTRDLRHASTDSESQRIAKLIELLADLNVRVDYSLWREHTPGHNDRWLCIIHVLHDFSFQKYRKNMKPRDMPLFRGFSIELNGKENDTDGKEGHMQVDAPENQESLMLKMKFLPYMVRTFGCRNGLTSLRQGGIDAFIRYTNGLMIKWKISLESRQKWAPFFRGWAEYALPRMNTIQPGESDLRLLTSENYLQHLERFEILCEAGKIQRESKGTSQSPLSKNQGLVVVVAPTMETAKAAADLAAVALDSAERIDDINAITKEDMEDYCLIGRGTICSAQLQDGVGRIRKFIGNFGKYISIILVGCSEVDIRSNEDLASDFKYYNGLASSWRKTRAVMVIDLPETAVSSSSSENSETDVTDCFKYELGKIRLVFQANEDLHRPKPGMLVFFPAMPGSGKSSVACVETERLLRTEFSKHEKQRNVILRMGDTTKGKFWQIVKGDRKKDTSCLYIADKNVPPNTWGTVASICAETKAMGLPIIPDNAALQTTVIEGIRKPDGTLDAERKHTYPFSLSFLAVCLYRVITRPERSHPGKLDTSQSRACMIVLKFYWLYRRTTSDEFKANMEYQFQQAGAVMGEPIEVPFFSKRTPDALPEDLESVLTEAVQAFYGYSVSKGDPTADRDDYITDMEHRLRETLKLHARFIESLTVDVSESRKVFVSKFIQRVAELDSIESWTDAEAGAKPTFIKLASIDVNVNDVHSLLVSFCDENKELAGLTQQLAGDSSLESLLTGETCQDKRFICSTHVTLAHFKETSQSELRGLVGAIVGEHVEMRVVAILWDSRVAALEVKIPETTTAGSVVPPSKNPFAHITLWCQQGASAFESNELPARVSKGEAKRVALASPANLLGEVSFWMR